MCPERLEFGPKQEDISLPTVVERLFPHAVAREKENTVNAVPQRNGKHADAFLERRFNSPGIETCEQRLRIGMTTPMDCSALRLLSQLEMVVDLPVEYKDEAPGVGHHWLVTGS